MAWRTLQAHGRRRQAASRAIARRSRTSSTAFRSWHLAAACCSTALVQASRRARALQRRSFIEWRRLATSERRHCSRRGDICPTRGEAAKKDFVPALCVWRTHLLRRVVRGPAGVWPIKRTRNKKCSFIGRLSCTDAVSCAAG